MAILLSRFFWRLNRLASSSSFIHPKIRLHHIEVAGGHRVFYQREGLFGNHPVLLLPGALGSTITDFASQLGPKGLVNEAGGDKFTVVGMDLPGYGKSRPPERSWPPRFFDRDAEAAIGVMRELKLTPFSVVGWSDGGITALVMASRLAKPGELRSMAVFGCNAYISPDDKAAVDKIRDVSAWNPKMRAPFEALYGVDVFPKLWSAWCDAYCNYPDEGVVLTSSELTSIRVPCLILHGAKDPVVPTFHPDHLHRHIMGSRMVIWPDAKHNLHLRYPQQFNSLIAEFLAHH